MTTKVTITVEEGGPWDALVTEVSSSGHEGIPNRVNQGETSDFYIHADQSLKISEVELEDEADDTAPDDAEDEGEANDGGGTEGEEG